MFVSYPALAMLFVSVAVHGNARTLCTHRIIT